MHYELTHGSMWLDALFLGALLALFVRWQVNVAATDKVWTKVLVYWLVLLHLGSSGYTLAYQIHLVVKGFGEYKNFLNVTCTSPLPRSGYSFADASSGIGGKLGSQRIIAGKCADVEQGLGLPSSSMPSRAFPPLPSSCTAPG